MPGYPRCKGVSVYQMCQVMRGCQGKRWCQELPEVPGGAIEFHRVSGLPEMPGVARGTRGCQGAGAARCALWRSARFARDAKYTRALGLRGC